MPPDADNLAMLSNAEREQIEGILFDFDSSWSPNALSEAAKSIPLDRDDVRISILEELVKIDIERRWSSGNGRELEDYLKQFPNLGTRETVSAALIQTEYEARELTGEPATKKEFQERFPEQFEELMRLVRESAKAKSHDDRALASLDTSQSGASDESVAETQDHEKPRIPQAFGRYRILRSLGQGAMGAVSLAHDTQLDREVAIKTPTFSGKSAPELIERFVREAKTAANLRHPNICPVHDVGEMDGQHFITMSYIDGKPLSAFIGGDKPKPERHVAMVIRKLALALEHAHSNGVVHRDLKPANIMIDGQREPIVMDFGLAYRANRPEEARVTQRGTMLGTPAYMSPEQVDADLDRIGAPTDIYSLGVIFYEFLTGQLPYNGSVAAILGQIMTQDPPKPSKHRSDLNPELESICLKMMAKKIEDRFASMKDVAAALTEFLKKRTVESGERKAESGDTAHSQKTLSAESGLRALFEATEQPQQSIIPQRGLVKAKSKKPKGEPKANLAARWKAVPTKWKAGIATAIAGVMLVASIVLIIRPAGGGVLRIEVEGDGIEVVVDKTTINLTDKKWEGNKDAGKHTLAVKLGEKELDIGPYGEIKVAGGKITLKLNGVELTSNKFTITRGETARVRITFVKDVVAGPVNAEWISLFDGKTLAGWETVGDDWKVADGQIASKVRPEKARMAPLWSKQTYDNFVLRFQFRCRAGSTLILRGSPLTRKGYWVILKPRGGRFPGQIFDSAGKRGRLVVKPTPESVAKLPPLAAKKWQSCEVRAIGHRLEVTIDGVKLVDIRDNEFRSGKIGFNFMELKEGLSVKDIQIRSFNVEPDTALPDGPPGELENLQIETGTPIDAMALSPDGRHVAVGARGLPQEFRVYDITTAGSAPKPIATFPHGEIRHLAYTADGSRILSAGRDKMVRVWDVNNPTKAIMTIGPLKETVYGLEVAPSGKWCATLLRDVDAAMAAKLNKKSRPSVHLRLWDLKTGRQLYERKANQPRSVTGVVRLSISPDGRYLSTNLRGGATVYEILDGTNLSITGDRMLSGPRGGRRFINPGRLVFSPNARFGIASGSGRVAVWDIMSGRAESTPFNAKATVCSVAFAHDDTWILAGNEQGELKIWDRMNLNKPPHVLKSRDGKPVNEHLFVTPDNRFAVTGGDSTIRVWRLPKLANEKPVPRKQTVAPVLNPAAQRAAVIEFLKRSRVWVTVEVDGQSIVLKHGDKLPTNPFIVKGVYVDRGGDLTEEEMAGLAAFTSLTSLRLRFCRLNDDMLRHVGRLSNLVHLDLINTGFGDAGLAHLKGLRKLGKLVLGGTKVSDAGLMHLADMPSLGRLSIQGTNVTGNNLSVLTSLRSLSWLTLGGPKFTEKRPAIDTLKKMTGLKVLKISGIKFTDSEKDELKNAIPQCQIAYGTVNLNLDESIKENPASRAVAEFLLRRPGVGLMVQTDEREIGINSKDTLPKDPFIVLTVIMQRQRNITIDELEKLSEFRSLSRLDLYVTRQHITDDKLKPIGKLTSLTMLRLNNTDIGDAGLKHLTGLTNLRSLTLHETKVGDAGLQHISQMTSLRELNLKSTNVTGGKLDALAKLEFLIEINLGGPKFTQKSAALKSLSKFPQLKRLNLNTTGFTKQELEAWRNDLKGVQISGMVSELENMSDLSKTPTKAATPKRR